jgi:HEAT repeat protein
LAIFSCFSTVFIATPSFSADSAETGRLLQIAAKSKGEKQYAAIDRLGERHESASQVVPELKKLLHADDDQVQWRSARALGDYRALAQDAAGDLRELMSDSDPIVQYHAAVALGKVDDRSDETVQALVAAATANDARVARAAIAALRNLSPGSEGVKEALGKALASNDQAVRVHALDAIVRLGPDAVPLLNEALKRPETTYLACAAIEHIGPDAAAAVPELTALLGDTKHSHLLIQTLLALASIGPAAQSAAHQIKPLLNSPTDATVPVAAAYALGSISAQDADAELRGALEKDDPYLQMIAAWALAKLHSDDRDAEKLAVEKLTQGLKNENPTIRTAAAKSLQSLQPPPEMIWPALVPLVNDPDPVVQAHVIETIAGLGEFVVPNVSRALQDPKFRGPAIRVLAKLGPKASGAVQALIDAANGANPEIRTEIQLTLAAIGPAAAPATDLLVKSIDSSDAGERESALYALRKIGAGARNSIRPLYRRMQAHDSFDAIAAAWALARIAPDNPQVSQAVLRKLSSALTNSDEHVRLQSAEALVEMGAAAKPAAAALERVAKEDRSAAVRAAAEAALTRSKQ